MVKRGKVTLALVAMLAAGPFLFAADAPPKPTLPANPLLTPVPKSVAEMAQRFMALTPEQDRKLRELQKARGNEWLDASAQLNQQLDAKFQPQVADVLDEPRKAAFAQVAAAMGDYWTAVAAADHSFRNAWEKATGEKFPAIGKLNYNLVYFELVPLISGLDEAQKETLKKLEMDYLQQYFDALRATQDDNAIQRPPGGNTDAWHEYQQKITAIQHDLEHKFQAAFIEKAREQLADASTAKKLKLIAMVMQERNAAMKQAADAMAAKLKLPVVGYVPWSIVAAAQQFMTPTPEQLKKLQELRTVWYTERQGAIEQISVQLDAKYRPQFSAAFEGKQKAIFEQLCDALRDYLTAVKDADNAFRDAWEKATAEKLFAGWDRYEGALGFAARMPALQDAQKKALNELQNELNVAFQEADRAARDASSEKRPAADDTAGWEKYEAKMAALQPEVHKKVLAAYTEKFRAQLGDTPAEKQFDLIAKALQEREAKKKQAEDTLADKLKLLALGGKLTPTSALSGPDK